MIECDKCKAQMEQTAKEEHIPNTELDIQYIQWLWTYGMSGME